MEEPTSQSYPEEVDERRLAPGKPWAVEVDVYLYEDNPPRFEVVSTLPLDKSDPNDELLIFDNKGSGGGAAKAWISTSCANTARAIRSARSTGKPPRAWAK